MPRHDPVTNRAWIVDGREYPISRDPLAMSHDELRKMGYTPMSPSAVVSISLPIVVLSVMADFPACGLLQRPPDGLFRL